MLLYKRRNVPMIKSKKGQVHHGFSVGHFLLASFIILAMAFVLVLSTSAYMRAFRVHDKDVPAHVYAYRSLNTCLAYQDKVTKRYYPSIIDFSKYTQENLEACYNNTNEKSFNIQLKDLDKQIPYNRILVGFGASMNIKSYPVLILYEGGSMSKGEFLFGISR